MLSSPLIDKQPSSGANDTLLVQSPGRPSLNDLTNRSLSPQRNNDHQKPASQSELRSPPSSLEVGNDSFHLGANADADQPSVSNGCHPLQHSSVVSGRSPASPPMLPDSSFYLRESSGPALPNESNGVDVSGAGEETEDAMLEESFGGGCDDLGMSLRSRIRSCQLKLRDFQERLHTESLEAEHKESDESISFKPISPNQLEQIECLESKMAKVKASRTSSQKPKPIEKTSWQFGWKKRARQVNWDDLQSVLGFLPKKTSKMLQPPAFLIGLYQCPLEKAHAVYYFNNKLTYEEQKLLKEAFVELVRNEKLLVTLEQRAAKKALKERKRLEREERKRKKKRKIDGRIQV